MKYFQQSYNPRRPHYVCSDSTGTWIGRHPKDVVVKKTTLIGKPFRRRMRKLCNKLNDQEQAKG